MLLLCYVNNVVLIFLQGVKRYEIVINTDSGVQRVGIQETETIEQVNYHVDQTAITSCSMWNNCCTQYNLFILRKTKWE